MVISAVLEHGGEPVKAVNQLLRALLEKGIVDALLVPQRTPAGDNVVQTLVSDTGRLEALDPLAPVVPVTAARLMSRLTATGHPGKLAAIMRPCEMRALVELVKLQQARMDGVLLIGFDCVGTYDVPDYAALARAGVDVVSELLDTADGQPAPHEGYQFRVACQMCEHPFPEVADVALGLVGVDARQRIVVQVSDDEEPVEEGQERRRKPLVERVGLTAEELVEKLGLAAGEPPAGWQAAREKLVAGRVETRDRMFVEFRQRVHDVPSLLAEFSTCIRCHNCMENCPICYCKECIFKGSTFQHVSPQYFRWAERKGAIRMPTDTLIFHLTRMNHMITSCVGCGLCTSACPMGIPVATIFRAVAEKTQALFDYVPGASFEGEVPLAEFREDELTSLGERDPGR